MYSILLAAQQGNSSSMLIWMIVFFVLIWLLMMRPQQKKAKEERKFRDSLKPGDPVLFSGGIYILSVCCQYHLSLSRRYIQQARKYPGNSIPAVKT